MLISDATAIVLGLDCQPFDYDIILQLLTFTCRCCSFGWKLL